MTEKPRDPAFESRVRDSFERQAAMAMMGATLAHVGPGEVAIDVPFRSDLTQQHGFLHAGVTTSVMDTACGYAALTLMDPGTAVLSIEFKVNLLAPAKGELFRATARVVRSGRTVSVVSGEFHVLDPAEETPVAVMTATMMTVRDRPGLVD